jgi:hypothetical protein
MKSGNMERKTKQERSLPGNKYYFGRGEDFEAFAVCSGVMYNDSDFA